MLHGSTKVCPSFSVSYNKYNLSRNSNPVFEQNWFKHSVENNDKPLQKRFFLVAQRQTDPKEKSRATHETPGKR